MQDDQEIIKKLGIEGLDDEKKAEIVEEVTMRIGEAMTDTLTDQQFDEYEAIVNDDHGVIDAWLQRNVPDFEDNPVFQEIAEGYEQDPEKNNPRKIFASMAWLEVTVPDLVQRIDTTLAAYKKELGEG